MGTSVSPWIQDEQRVANTQCDNFIIGFMVRAPRWTRPISLTPCMGKQSGGVIAPRPCS